MKNNNILEINNDEVEALLTKYTSEKTGESLAALLDKMHGCKVLVPAQMSPKGPVPIVLKQPNGESFVPVFTSKKQITSQMNTGIINISFVDICGSALNNANNKDMKLVGLVINPFTTNIVFKIELLQRIVAVEEARKRAVSGQPGKTSTSYGDTVNVTTKTVQMTEKEYLIFERKNFEMVCLPQRFHTEKAAFIQMLLEKREELLDEMYEEMYQQKRMYPYLPEDFSVMPLNISDDLLIVRIDFPTKDMAQGCSTRAYLAWNEKDDMARYFLIQAGVGKEKNLCEIIMPLSHVGHGPAPVEGVELTTIIDMVSKAK